MATQNCDQNCDQNPEGEGNVENVSSIKHLGDVESVKNVSFWSKLKRIFSHTERARFDELLEAKKSTRIHENRLIEASNKLNYFISSSTENTDMPLKSSLTPVSEELDKITEAISIKPSDKSKEGNGDDTK